MSFATDILIYFTIARLHARPQSRVNYLTSHFHLQAKLSLKLLDRWTSSVSVVLLNFISNWHHVQSQCQSNCSISRRHTWPKCCLNYLIEQCHPPPRHRIAMRTSTSWTTINQLNNLTYRRFYWPICRWNISWTSKKYWKGSKSASKLGCRRPTTVLNRSVCR